MYKCLKCGTQIQGKEQFCTGCGAKLNLCQQCGAPHDPDAEFCVECGAKLQNSEQDKVQVQPVRPVTNGQNKKQLMNIIICVLVALCLAGGGFYVYRQQVLIPQEKAREKAQIEAARQEQEKAAKEAEQKQEAEKKAQEQKAQAAAAEEASRITKDEARSCFKQYIGFLNQRNFGAAYAKYSEDWQSQTSYNSWSNAYNTTIDQRVDIKQVELISHSRARLYFVLYARDRKNGRVVNSVFSGNWDVIKDSNGGCYLDNPDVHLDRTY